MDILKPSDIIQHAIDGVTDPVVAFAKRRFGWNRFELMSRIEFVRTPVDFVLVAWFLERISRTDWHQPPMPAWMAIAFMAINIFWSCLRLRAGWEMGQVGAGRSDRIGTCSALVARARKVGVRHWYWTLVFAALCLMLPILALSGLIDGFPLFCAQMLSLSAWIAVTLLSHMLWNHPDVAAVNPPSFFTDD